MFKAAIFDLDGLMIDSEPIWREVLSEVLTARGAPVTIRECAQTMGLRVDEVIRYWQPKFPAANLQLADTQAEVIEGVLRLIAVRGEPLPGVTTAIALVRSMGMKLALASSSSTKIINTVLERFELHSAFEVVCSAENEKQGKPAPDVYLSTIRALGILPEEGVAFEDSTNGVKAAKAAGLCCIGVPDSHTDRATLPADLLLNSLDELTSGGLCRLHATISR